MSKILLLSGSRADLAYLIPVAEGFKAAGAEVTIEGLQNAIAGVHTAQAIAERAGAILSAGGRTLAEGKPDMMVVLGDRWEIATACIAAVLARIPIAHIGAGEDTWGSYDQQFRRAIEGMAALKFALTERGRDSIPDAILAGCTSVSPPAEVPKGNGHAILALYPETAGNYLSHLVAPIEALLEARGIKVTRIGANPDVGSAAFAGQSLTMEEFHARLSSAEIIVGNSSAGIVEAPILCTPTVNIGRRQEGRQQAQSVFQAEANTDSIAAAIDNALRFGKQRVESPYYRPDAVQIIVEVCLEHLRNR